MTTMHTEHSATACRAARHTRVQHLITADENSLSELQALIVTLPMCSTGRVFIEVPDAQWVGEIAVPARMIVTWLDRSRRTGEAGSGRSCSPGQALARAVAGWADEMLCSDGASTHVHLLGGYLGSADIVDHLTEKHGFDRDDIHTPERFGLTRAR